MIWHLIAGMIEGTLSDRVIGKSLTYNIYIQRARHNRQLGSMNDI